MSWTLVGVVGLISGGVALAVMGEGKAFSGMGFALVMLAATASGLRWTLTQYYMTARARGPPSPDVVKSPPRLPRLSLPPRAERRTLAPMPLPVRPPQELKHGQSPLATLATLLPTMCGFVVLSALVVEQPWQEARRRSRRRHIPPLSSPLPTHVRRTPSVPGPRTRRRRTSSRTASKAPSSSSSSPVRSPACSSKVPCRTPAARRTPPAARHTPVAALNLPALPPQAAGRPWRCA